jgi:CDGSH-type Zn-finger protein
MNEPIMADGKPMAVEVEAGKRYFWCACGQSANQPFCDGSHRGTDFTPLAFSPEADGTVYLCMCKHTAKPPHCDGTHKTLDTGKEPGNETPL